MPPTPEAFRWWWAAYPVAAFGIAAALTGWIKHYALAKQILDHPNERSSHATAMPRGGGVSLVVVIPAGFVAAALAGGITPWKAAAIVAGGIAVALAGWWDDRWGLSVGKRFAAHLGASALATYALGPLDSLNIAGIELHLGWAGAALAAIGIAALINITNFMDGIDGIAGSEGAFVFAAMALLARGQLALPAAVAAAACGGFLLWNWPPAKIFMGDVGSGFLGYAMGIFILWGRTQDQTLFWSFALLPSAFMVDGVATLLYRFATGQKWLNAHRNHAYQHAALSWGHLRVVLAFGAINVAVILPLAWLAKDHAEWGFGIFALCWATLAICAYSLGAGTPSSRESKVVFYER